MVKIPLQTRRFRPACLASGMASLAETLPWHEELGRGRGRRRGAASQRDTSGGGGKEGGKEGEGKKGEKRERERRGESGRVDCF